jgi:hypothetical protein
MLAGRVLRYAARRSGVKHTFKREPSEHMAAQIANLGRLRALARAVVVKPQEAADDDDDDDDNNDNDNNTMTQSRHRRRSRLGSGSPPIPRRPRCPTSTRR